MDAEPSCKEAHPGAPLEHSCHLNRVAVEVELEWDDAPTSGCFCFTANWPWAWQGFCTQECCLGTWLPTCQFWFWLRFPRWDWKWCKPSEIYWLQCHLGALELKCHVGLWVSSSWEWEPTLIGKAVAGRTNIQSGQERKKKMLLGGKHVGILECATHKYVTRSFLKDWFLGIRLQLADVVWMSNIYCISQYLYGWAPVPNWSRSGSLPLLRSGPLRKEWVELYVWDDIIPTHKMMSNIIAIFCVPQRGKFPINLIHNHFSNHFLIGRGLCTTHALEQERIVYLVYIYICVHLSICFNK